MHTNHCLSCNAVHGPNARYCPHCGKPIRMVGGILLEDEQRQQLEALLRAHRRRLALSVEQAAKLGLHVPPHILIDIEDAQREITRIEALLRSYVSTENETDWNILKKQALQAYYKKDWGVAFDMLTQVVAMTPTYEYTEMLGEANRQLHLQAFYRAICELRNEGQWKAVLNGLNDLKQRQPDFLDTEGLQEWAEAKQSHNQVYPYILNARKEGDWITVIALVESLRAAKAVDEELEEWYVAADSKQREIEDQYNRTKQAAWKVIETAKPYFPEEIWKLTGLEGENKAIGYRAMRINLLKWESGATHWGSMVYKFYKAKERFNEMNSKTPHSTIEFNEHITAYSQITDALIEVPRMKMIK